MELKRKLDFKKVFWLIYFVCFLIYLIIGLQPAEARRYEVLTNIIIPEINLSSEVVQLEIENNKLNTPDEVVGSFSNHKNKVLLIGHSTTIFSNLNKLKLRDKIIYNDEDFFVKKIEMLPKEKISMNDVLKEEESSTLVLMTCAGVLLGDGDATHRLIIYAES